MSDLWIIVGASSAMARALSRALANQGHTLWLLGRDQADLEAMAADCTMRGAAQAEAIAWDARDTDSFTPVISRASEFEGTVNAAVFVGSMPPQEQTDADPGLLAGVVQDSLTGPATFLHQLAPLIESRGKGTIVGVGSVAGDRGRIKNYVYGAAKGGFATYLAGLRNRLTRSGGHVVTVKPGFVDTEMTWGLEGMFLVATPEAVAKDILKAVRKKRDTLYTPFFWRYIMLIITHIPERIFKKMSI